MFRYVDQEFKKTEDIILGICCGEYQEVFYTEIDNELFVISEPFGTWYIAYDWLPIYIIQ